MEQHSRLLLDVWREACRHIEIAEATDLITPLIVRHLPVDQLALRVIDLERGTVDTVAASARDHSRPGARLRSECSPEDIDRLLQWCLRGEIVHEKVTALRKRLPGLVPEGVTGDVLAGPLRIQDGAPGVLITIAAPPQSFKAEHEKLLKVLLEPFAVALENDRRLHELMALREKVEAENRSLLTKLGRNDLSDAIVGAETGLRPVMDRVSIVARADIPVLILGETGSGKEVVARAIHNQSRRAGGPFLRVNCGALPPELVDSELFGHERGSFTGATALRKGWFERADRGTLFLDECGELPPAAQVRLLRILQDGTFERVGGERQMHVNVRVVAATHRNLQAMVGEGTFREDLWYRLAVFPIELPPLRDRPEDIAALATHFAPARPNASGCRAHADARRHQLAGGLPVAGQRARIGRGDRARGAVGGWQTLGGRHGDRRDLRCPVHGKKDARKRSKRASRDTERRDEAAHRDGAGAHQRAH